MIQDGWRYGSTNAASRAGGATRCGSAGVSLSVVRGGMCFGVSFVQRVCCALVLVEHMLMAMAIEPVLVLGRHKGCQQVVSVCRTARRAVCSSQTLDGQGKHHQREHQCLE